MPGLADADPIPLALTWLAQHPRMTAVLGAPAAQHVSGLLEAPWPRVLVADGPGGDLGDGRWNTHPDVLIEVYGHPAGVHGRALLKRIALTAVACLVELPDRTDLLPTDLVVTDAGPSGVAVWQPLETGQGRYTVGVLLAAHPPITDG